MSSVPTTATSPDEILRLKREYLVPCVFHFYRDPPHIVGAEDCTLIGHDGKRYIDFFSGVTVTSAGHANSQINAAAAEQMNRLDHTTTIYLTEPIVRLAERLAAITPGRLKRSFFGVSGSEANEGALLLACLHTGRSNIIALTDSLHGRTKWSMSVTGLEMWRTDPNPCAGVHFAPHAHCPICPLGQAYPACALACADELERALVEAGPDTVAAVIAEPIQGNGGIVVPPDDYWPRVRRICDRYGVLLIFDEIQTGMNRTGRWWACEHWDVVPDILTTAKALANGYPIGAYITTDEIAASYTRPGASTFGGNPVAAATALRTIEFHEQNELGSRASERGGALRKGLQSLAETVPALRNPRGKGLMLGASVVDAAGQPDAERVDTILEALKDRGFLAGKTGRERNVLTLMPPLTIQPDAISAFLEALRATFSETEPNE